MMVVIGLGSAAGWWIGRGLAMHKLEETVAAVAHSRVLSARSDAAIWRSRALRRSYLLRRVADGIREGSLPQGLELDIARELRAAETEEDGE